MTGRHSHNLAQIVLMDDIDIIILMSTTRTNEQWLDDLRADGAVQEAAIAELRSILLRTVLFFFSRNTGDFSRLARAEVLHLAEDCTQEALIAIMNHLSDFRGESRFTTWVYKFAVNKALIAARRERWRGMSLDQPAFSDEGSLSEWMLQGKSSGSAPDQSSMQVEVREVILDVIKHDLTDKQRHVLIMMVFNEVPMDVLVHQLGTNRNAIYKLLHDARRKLKAGLKTRGFDVGEMLALFGVQR